MKKIFDEEQINEIFEALENEIENNELKAHLISFLTDEIKVSELIFDDNNQRFLCKNDFLMLIILVKNTISNINEMFWSTYCLKMNEITYSKKIGKHLVGKSKDLRRFVQLFYAYIAKLTDNKEIKEHWNLFITNELQQYTKNEKIKYIQTNFPVKSNPFQIYQMTVSSRRGTQYLANIYLNTDNPFLINILTEFLDVTKETTLSEHFNSIEYRFFFYYFSTEEFISDIQDLKGFNRSTFLHQFRFFKKKLADLNLKNASIFSLLRSFYLFVNQLYLNENGTELFTEVSFNSDLLKNKQFYKYLEENYSFIYKNSYELIPIENKWILLSEPNAKNASYSSAKNFRIDFDILKNDKFRDELKEYIWNKTTSNSNLTFAAQVIIDFLNAADDYYNQNISLIKGKKKLFSSNFILFYRTKLESESTSDKKSASGKSFNNKLSVIRNYLEHIQPQYQIPTLAIEQLAFVKTEYIGGNPFTASDFKVLSETFQLNAKENIENELHYIIFQLATSTKLRLGEILNLERNCILSKNVNGGFGELQYISKTSNGEKIIDTFLLEDLQLIEKAITLTTQLSQKAEPNIKNFIFIRENKENRNAIIRFKHDFTNYFSALIQHLYDNGKLEREYKAYHSRHTFIDKAWERVEDGSISSLEVGTITGNSAKVASKHYREHKTKRYIEATYMITIGDVNSEGELIKDENEVEELPQVEMGAGGCNNTFCIKMDSEDTEFKCLTCPKFVTSIDRKDIFEERLSEYRTKMDNAKSNVERNYYESYAKLYGSYLSKILDKIEEVHS